MTLTQFKYVVAMDDYRNFTKAAEHCLVTQPTLSAQVQKLERDLGVEIFDRSASPIRPTETGRRVIRQARVVLGEMGRLRELVRGNDEVAGELHVGVLPTLAPCILTRFMAELTARYPELRLRVVELHTEEIVNRLEKGQLEAGLLATPTDSRTLKERPLFREPFVAYLSDDHRLWGSKTVQADQLRRGELWLLRDGHCFREHVLELCTEMAWEGTAAPALRFESGNLETLKRLVETKGGMTLLPQLVLYGMDEERRARVRPFQEPVPTRTIRLVHRETGVETAILDAFADGLLGTVREGMPEVLS